MENKKSRATKEKMISVDHLSTKELAKRIDGYNDNSNRILVRRGSSRDDVLSGPLWPELITTPDERLSMVRVSQYQATD